MAETDVTDHLRFDGRVAVVTGAGGGIGREHARLLAARGAKVVVNDLGCDIFGVGSDPNRARETATEIVEAGGDAIPNSDSVAEPGGAESLIQSALDGFGRVDIVINNAGIFETRPLEDTDVANLRMYVETNLIGSAAVAMAAWPHFVEAGYGRLVNTQSSAGIVGMLSRLSYATAKTGILGLTKCLAHEGVELGIKVNLVNPAARTRMWTDPLSGEPVADVPGAPAPGEADEYAPHLVSPMFAVLAHESCPVTGEMFNSGTGRITRQFIADTVGFQDIELTPETIVERWDEVINETDYFAPEILRPYRGM
jgi:NAD(P)-dependent dehydrogenase (short-subunit alcohol dehydrogenase family)